MTERSTPDDTGADGEPKSHVGEPERLDDESKRDDAMPGWSSSHGSLSDNLVFAAVDNPRRRFILEALQEEDGQADVDELVDDVATIEEEADELGEDCSHEEYLEALYDAELPELADIGVVDLDEKEGTVELGPYADELDLDAFTPDVD